MKKFMLLTVFLMISFILYASVLNPGVPEKIKEIFQQQFPQIKNPSFFSYGDSYEAYFKKEGNASERIYYNLDGAIINTIKYYFESALEPFIKEKLHKNYKGKIIQSITELQSNFEHFYQIILEDDNSLYVVKCDDKGSLETKKIFNRRS